MHGLSEIMKEKVTYVFQKLKLPMVTKQSIPNLLQVHDATKLFFKGMQNI